MFSQFIERMFIKRSLYSYIRICVWYKSLSLMFFWLHFYRIHMNDYKNISYRRLRNWNFDKLFLYSVWWAYFVKWRTIQTFAITVVYVAALIFVSSRTCSSLVMHMLIFSWGLRSSEPHSWFKGITNCLWSLSGIYSKIQGVSLTNF